MALFDPVSVNKQIDAMLAAVPKGKHVMLIGSANLRDKKASVALIGKINDTIGGYVRFSKTMGSGVDADAGVQINFLVDQGEDTFMYNELVAVFKGRGLGWFRSHVYAYRLLNGGKVEL